MSLVAIISRTVKFRPLARNLLHCKQCRTVNNPVISYSTAVTKPLHELNTNVAKDVLLFKYENPKFFRYMNFFAIVQYIFWTYLGSFAFTTLRDAPVDESKITEHTSWLKRIYLGQNKYRNALAIFALLIGGGSLALIWMYTLKSVRFLVLNKGGNHVTFVTYAPFGKNRLMKVPLDCVCCKENRTMARVQLPLKVKDTWMHYMLDMRGEFKNPVLFDCTAGLYRNFK